MAPARTAAQVLMGAGLEGGGSVRVITSTQDITVPVFPGSPRSEVSVALGDIDGDGVPDLIAGAGAGSGPHVRVFRGTDLHESYSFFAYGSGFTGGVSVAAGDINGDGRTDIVTAPGRPGGQVRVFSGLDLSLLASFNAFDPALNVGVRVAVGDLNGDGRADIITAAAGGSPEVRVFSGVDGTRLLTMLPYGPRLPGGVYVAAGDVNGDGRTDLITGAGPGGAPHVQAFSGADGTLLASFNAFSPTFTGGVRVAAGDVDGDGRADLIAGAGAGVAHVRVFSGLDLHEVTALVAFAAGSGVNVAGNAAISPLRFTSAAGTTFEIGTAGTFAVTTSGVPAPVLTATGTPPAGVTFVDHGDGSGTLSGTPATSGQYPLSFVARDAGVVVGIQAFTLTVVQAPAITSAASATFAIGTTNTFSVTAIGFPSPTLTATGALPPGVTFVDNGNGTGALRGNPTPGTAGTYQVTITGANGVGLGTVQQFALTVTGPASRPGQMLMGAGLEGGGAVRVVSSLQDVTVPVFPGSPRSEVSVALGDVDGDGVPDLITGAGAGSVPHVRVLSGTDLHEVYSFLAYAPDFTGGVTVAAGDVNGDGRTDIVTGPGRPGAPMVRVFSGLDLSALASFNAFDPTFTGGVRVAVGDLNGDGRADIITAAAGGNPEVRVFSGSDGTRLLTMLPYGARLPGGVYVAAGDINGDGLADLITGAGPGGGPHVQAFSGAGGALLASFNAFDPTFTGGVRVAAGDVDGDGRADLIVGAAAGVPRVRVFSGVDLHEVTALVAFAAGSGVTVAGGGAPSALEFTSTAATTFEVGTAGTFAVTTSGVPVPVLTLTGTLPAGVTFVDNGDGTATLSGTPAAATGGNYPLTLTASNGVAPDEQQTFTLSVSEPLAITSGNATTMSIGVAGSFTVIATGFPVPALTLGGAALPAGLTFVDNGNGTGTLSGTPSAGTGGSYALQFTASNGIGTNVVQAFTLTVSGAPTFTSANTTTFSVGSAGTFTVAAIGSPTPTVAVGGALPAGVTFVANADGTGTLSGTPAAGTGGVHTVTFTASNGVLPNATQTFTLNVNQAPAITSASTTAFSLGAPNSFTVTTSGFPAPTIARGGASLPAGVTFVDNGNGTATLSGTPGAGTGGTYALTFTASNVVGSSATQNFTLSISGSPGFTSAATTTFTVGTPGSFTVTAVGSPAPAITVTGTLPAGVTFTNNLDGTGTLSGTPAAGTGGVHAITFTAANGLPPDATQAFTLNVNEAPVITSAASATFAVGVPGTFTVTTIGFPTPALAQGGGALPSGVTFVDNGNGTGTLSGTPAPTTADVYSITFTATNPAGSSAPQAFTLTVNEAPSFTSANTTTFTVGTPGSFTVTTLGTPLPTASVSGALPSGVTFVADGNGGGVLSGTPAAGTGGTYPLTFTAANGVLPDATQAFTLIVNQAPAITSAASVIFTVGAAGSFTVTTTGFPVPSLALGDTLPSGVSFVDNGNGTGTLSGTPAAGTGGTYAISFTATNTVGSSLAQAFTMTVNEAPAITSANTTNFTIGVAGSFIVTASGFPTATIARGGVALPAGVTFVDNGNGTGTLSGTPAVGTGGTYAITFTATNGVGSSPVQAFTLNVQAPPAITSAGTTTFTVGVPGTFTVTTTGFPTPTVSQTGALPAGVTFTPATRVLGGTATQTGAFPIVFTASNGVPPDVAQNFTLTVVCPTITVNPATMPDGLYQTAYGPVTFTQTGSTGSTITWSATGLPLNLTIGATTGVVSGTPDTTVLNAAVQITATDNFGCTGTRNTTLTVRPVADNENYTGGVGNTQYVVGVSPVPTTPHVLNADAGNATVKMGDSGPGTLSVTFPATSANGGAIVEGADGTFIYTPAVGFAGPSDTFIYTLTDGNGVTNTATVTINLGNLVWYVNSSGGNGDGRSHNPFNTLASAATASTGNSTVYVHSGAATTPGDLAMDANQVLFGAGATFNLSGLTIGAGARPTLTGTVTLANNTSVTATNFAGTGVAMTGSAITAPVTIDQVNVTGGTNALSLTNVTGAVTITNANFTNTTGAEVLISGGTGNVTVAATISSNAGRVIDIQNRTSGTLTFTGAITDTGGTGIFLNNNGTSTFSFSGGLTLNGASTTFTATNPSLTGTLTITGTNTIGATTPPTTGMALNVANTTIAASGLTFRSISANGATNGVVLSSTGTAGGLTVTGTGTAGTGGTIQNITNRGVSIDTAADISLSWMTFTNAATTNGADPTNHASGCGDLTTGGNLLCNAPIHLSNVSKIGGDPAVTLARLTITNSAQVGINVNNVDGLSLTNTTISGIGNQTREYGIKARNLFGAVTFGNLTISNSFGDHVRIDNNGAQATTLNVTNSAFSTTTEGNGFVFNPNGTATTIANIASSSFTSNFSTGLIIGPTQPTSGGTVTIDVTGGPFTNNNAGIQIFGNGTTDVTYDIHDIANISGNPAAGIQNDMSDQSQSTASLVGTIRSNTVTMPASGAGNGIGLTARGAGTSTISVTNNAVTSRTQYGIHLHRKEGLAPGTLNATVTGNTVTTSDTAGDLLFPLDSIRLEAGAASADTGTVCANISGNTATGAGSVPAEAPGDDIRLRMRFAHTFQLPGLVGTDATAAINLLNTNNPASGSINATTTTSFASVGSCPTP